MKVLSVFITIITLLLSLTMAKYTAEVILLDQEVIVFKSGSDCKFYVSGSNDENELVLLSVLEAVYDSVYSLMKGQVDKRTMLDNLELILLTIDETVIKCNIAKASLG
jgi:coatomer subunit zeta